MSAPSSNQAEKSLPDTQFTFEEFLLFLDPEQSATRELISELDAKNVYGPRVGKLRVFKLDLKVKEGENLEITQVGGISVRLASKAIETAPTEETGSLLAQVKPMLASQGSQKIWEKAKELAQREEKKQTPEERTRQTTPSTPAPQEKTRCAPKHATSLTVRCIKNLRIVVEEAQRRMLNAGFVDTNLVLDGEIHRVNLQSDREKRTGKTGWYVGFSDEVPVVVYGDWRLGYTEKVSGADPDFIAEVLRMNPTGVVNISKKRFDEAQQRIEESIKRQEAERAKAAEAATRTGWARYDAASPGLTNAGYLCKKGVLPSDGVVPGLRCEEDGTLLVPLYRSNRFVGIQTIIPNGEKRFLKGTKKKASSFFLEGQTDSEKLFLCEGIATALSIWMATGASVLTCFDCGNLPAVAEEIRSGNIPEAQGKTPLVACDRDESRAGEKAGREAAKILGCGYLIPSFSEADPKAGFSDYNDLHFLKGLEAVRTQLEQEPLSTHCTQVETPCAEGKIRVRHRELDIFMSLPDTNNGKRKLLDELAKVQKEAIDCLTSSSFASRKDAVEVCISRTAPYAWTNLLDVGLVQSKCREVLETNENATATDTVEVLWKEAEARSISFPVVELVEADGVRLPNQREDKEKVPCATAVTDTFSVKEGNYGEEKERILEKYGGRAVFLETGNRTVAARDALALLGKTERSKRSVSYIPGGRNPQVFQTTTGQLIRLKPVLDINGRRTTTLTPQLLDREILLYELDDSGIAWMRYNSRAKKWARIDAPEELAKAIFASMELDSLPVLKGCLSSPIIDLETGKVSPTPGYDAQSGWFSSWTEGWSPMSKDKAIATLNDALEEFPFETKEDKAVAVAAMFTAVIRPLLQTAPGVAITAGAPGTGKTCLCALLSVMSVGKVLPTIDFRENADELRKSLFSLMRGGSHPVVIVDNIPSRTPVDSSFLNQLLSGETITERVLGVSESETVDVTKTLWLFNGNHLNLHADTTRRLILCSLQRDEESPARHVFQRKNFIRWAEENRTELVTAALSLLSEYIISGRPKPKGWGDAVGYEDWANIISGTCLWCGYEDPLGSLERLKQEDSRQEDIVDLFDAWMGAFAVNEYVSTSDLMKKCFSTKDDTDETDPYVALGAILREVLSLRWKVRSRDVVGGLKGFVGTVIGNKKLVHRTDPHTKKKFFAVASIRAPLPS